eukprot:TRINITY_DN6843_c0_g1_i1.p1 TRINITY_DN6843_c0_g1~~TRINITY_DN6843_c0_g1_i1.p1  ORF type:complete len:428 (+),score=67.36 TRINITY_DN6843_c0_g1_i1:42-1325(+)
MPFNRGGHRSSYACCGCGRCFDKEQAQLTHEESCKEVATCPGCDSHFSLEEFSRHIAHSSCDARQCRRCGIVFSCVEEYESHCVQEHHGLGLLPLRSPQQTPSAQTPLKTAAAAHTARTPLPPTSQRASHPPTLPQTLQAVRKCQSLQGGRKRGTSRDFTPQPEAQVCPGCRRSFVTGSDLRAHIIKQGTQGGRPQTCPVSACIGCSLPFASAEAAAAHEEDCWKVLQCPGCECRFGNAKHFARHVKDQLRGSECSATQCTNCRNVFGSPEEAAGCPCGKSKLNGCQVKKPPLAGYVAGSNPTVTAVVPVRPPSQSIWNPSPRSRSLQSDVFQQQASARNTLPNLRGCSPNKIVTQEASVEEVLRDIELEIKSLRGVELRRRLRSLQLCWHPDQAWRWHIDDAMACRVFTFVQGLWKNRLLLDTNSE